MSKLIIDKHDINYFGDEENDDEDEYDVVARQIAHFLREEMQGTLKRHIIVEVE